MVPFTAVALAVGAVAMASAGGNSSPSALVINPSDFSTNITNPFFPLSSLGPKVFEGEEIDPDTSEVITTRLESRVLPTTTTIAGVEVLILEEKAYANGELIEVALDYFAQHTDGTVYYFGEDVDNYINGVIDNHDGTWHAGVNGAEPGIIMPATPSVGQIFNQENAPGIAEDMGEVLALNETVGTAAGEFTGCIRIEDTNPLETPIPVEHKFYCPNIGFVRVDGADSFEELVSFSIIDQNGSPTPSASPTASPDASPTATASATPSPEPSPTSAPSPTPTPAATAAADDDEDEDDEADDDGDEPDDDDEDEEEDDDGPDDDDDDENEDENEGDEDD
jgi:hypothetical protein